MVAVELITKARSFLSSAKNPLYLFDDDADGICAYLLLYRAFREGRAYLVKSKPHITASHATLVRDEDALVVLDVALMDQEFVDVVKRPVLWIDHHPCQEIDKVLLVNDVSVSTAAMCYQIVKRDLWLAAVGSIDDHLWPPFIDEFKQQYADLLGTVHDLGHARFDAPVGVIARVISFSLKGDSKTVKRSLQALQRVKSPYEILGQETVDARWLWARYLDVHDELLKIKEQAMRVEPEDGLWVFVYTPGRFSITKDLANEMMYRKSLPVLLLGRLRRERIVCSLRSRSDIPLATLLKTALQGIEGYGGGHRNACGASIAREDFDRFCSNIRVLLKKYLI
ncbi:hypothetical protein GF342_01510 [Candidatus Woesearchaeota archaeon]|nr:hypothetical protein [Candidatus Woesearchaeota archaeon]